MPHSPADVWVDTDTAIGVPGADVDDALALIQAFHSPEIRVRGVSSVYGNAPLDKTHPIASEVVDRFGPPGLRVSRGAASADDLGTENDAVRALAAALDERPLAILALGPLTNLGTLVHLYPELVPRIRSLVAVAARRPGQRFVSVDAQPRPFPDLNFDCDPPAMQALLDSGIELIFAPWEVSSHVWLTGRDLDQLEESGETGSYIARHSRSWLEIWQKDLGAPGFNPFDTLAVAWATHPHRLRHFEAGVWIEDGPDDTATPEEQAAGKQKPHLLVDARRTGRSATYCFEPSPDFKRLLLERLAGRPAA
ncbi:MAG: nucleoside hydrolase [Proteobacteria bacterium]|nr:nucleoside hydrolase [Pseudomonadota bacterium]